jgi:hypothetical protein
MKKTLLVLIVTGLIVFAACSKKNNPGKSSKIVATTYTMDVAPLIQAKCTPCHVPSKGGRKASFETYEAAKQWGAEMVSRIERNPGDRGFMPFKNPKLPAEEIAVFKKWVADGLLEK